MRSKRGATRGRGRGGGGGGGAHNNHSGRHGPNIEADFVPFSGMTLPRAPSHGLSLQAEALNTQRHESSWSSDQRLRDTKVNFVSAGGFQPSLTRDPETAMADMSLKESVSDIEHAVEKMEAPKSEDNMRTAENFKAGVTKEMPEEAFIIDTEGTQPIKTGLPAPRIRSPSPSPSNSSEEVILFGGRDSSGKGILRPPSSRSRPTETSDLRRIIDDDVLADIEMATSTPHSGLIVGEEASFSGGNNASKNLSSEFSPLINPTLYKVVDESFSSRQSTSRKRRDRSRCHQARQNDDALMADYIANIKEQGLDLMSSHNRRELGGNDSDPWQDTGESSTEIQQITLDHGWSGSDLADFDNLSTSDGVMGSVQTILSKRIRQSGKQYLVVWEDCTVDEARWVPEASLTDGHVLGLIAKFEAEQTLIAEMEISDSDADESDSEDKDDMNTGLQSDASEDDNADLLQRKFDSMTDEQIARLLAKQEELGMDSTEVRLFDGLDDGNMDDFITSGRPSRRSRRGNNGSKRSNGEFPSATLLADAYDGFDVMDFERPSLKSKPKGRKGRLAFDLSDSELEASMQSSWNNDRLKKKERKQEREELRGLGLLGNAHNKPDLKLKYKEGMGIDTVKEEIKRFLKGDNTTLSLPPMEKGDRKVVHDIANAFNLKSKSAGSGRKRFPVLYRTQRTSIYVESTFNAVISRKNRRFLPRMDMNGNRSVTRVNAGGFSAAVSYRDGDVVGGSAPELGIENRGRAMLEKMGWSSGTALGALNNKGILQPVSHVVKTTKAGLG